MKGVYYPRRRKSLAERLWAKVDTSGECWIWTGATSFGGYGELARPGPRPQQSPVGAHRVSYELAFGAIPPDAVVMHRCDNPPCVRPSHLQLGTKAENSRDMKEKGRHRSVLPTHIRRGGEIPTSRLAEDDIPLIRAAHAAGEDYESIAARYGVSAGTIRYVCVRHTWKHVP